MAHLGWRVVGASAAGTSHTRAGLPCQDAHAYRLLPGGRALLAVADGAGSAERSEAGAAAAVAAALDSLAGALGAGWPSDAQVWAALFGQAYHHARAALEQLAAAEERPPRDFAATLLVAALSDGDLALAQLGDGLAVANHGDDWLVAAAPQRGEYANETHFLTQPDALERVETFHYSNPMRAVMLMTDGLLRLVLDLKTNTPHLPFFGPMMAFMDGLGDSSDGGAKLRAFLNTERINARTDDDKTLVMAARRAVKP